MDPLNPLLNQGGDNMSQKTAWIVPAVIVAVSALWFLFTGGLIPERHTDQASPEAEPGNQVITLKFGHDMPEASAQHKTATRYAKVVNYKTQNRVKIEVYPAQSLGTDQSMIEMAREGQLAIILPPTAKMTTLVPELQVLDLPFLFPDRQSAYAVLDGAPGQTLLSKLRDHGLVGVSFWESGFKQFTANRPIRTPRDFHGLNIRVMKSQTIIDQYRALGANPIPIDFHKTYQALADGSVDGQENPLVSIVNMKFYEVQPCMTISNHGYLAQALVFSKTVLNSLPREIQNILLVTGKELASFERQQIMEDEKKFFKTIQDSGTRVHGLTDQEKKEFRQSLEPVYINYPEDKGKEILSMIQNFLVQRKITQQNEIVIGLNADMNSSSALSGKAIHRGMMLAVDEINRSGGLLGKKFRVVARNNSGLSARGLENLKEFSAMDNLLAVMCGIYSPIALASIDFIHQEKIIYLDPWAAATKIVDNGHTPNYVFRISVRDADAGPFLVSKAGKKYKDIALLLVNDGWGHGNEQGMLAALEQQGMSPTDVQWFSWGQKDMTEQLSAIEASGAEVILMVSPAAEGATIIKNMAARKKKLPIISHWGITGGMFWESVKEELKTVDLSFLQTYSFFGEQTQTAQNLMNDYFKMFQVRNPGDIFAPVGTAHAYDLVRLIAMAVEQARTTDRPLVRSAMENLGAYPGVVKNYNPAFTPKDHDALGPESFLLCRYDSTGHIIPMLEPEPDKKK